MAKIDDQINKLISKITSLNGKILSKENLNELAEKVKENIIKRTVSGKGVDIASDNEYKFPELSDKYIEQRKRYSKNLSKNPKTTAKKSHVVATGSLINSINHKLESNGSITVLVKNTPRKTLSGKGASADNKTIQQALLDKYFNGSAGGRRFLALSNKDKKTIKDFFTEKIKNFLDSIKK